MVGHGWCGGRVVGGFGMISSWVTERAPWRWAVPTQSAPVSPPPMTTTCLPSAVMGGVAKSPSWTRLASGRYSMAWVDAGEGGGPGWAGPATRCASGEDDGVVVGAQLVGGEVHADVDAGAELGAFGAHLASRRSRCRFSSLNSGMP